VAAAKIDIKTSKMKKIFLFVFMAFALASCSAQLTEKVMATYPDGTTRVVHYYDKNDQCVKETEYYETGQVKMEGGMKDGKMDGEWTAYFIDGRVQSHGFFKNGKRTGAAQVFYSNGNKYEEGSYKEGKHIGLWKFYDEQGNLIKEADYGEGE
jgi:antitoxin component YwqK of YwqJK toxin-antitoxin module